MKVLCAMSGGVDSSVAAWLLREQGHEVVGVTMKLWGGASDTGCCSISDVDDARRVAQQLDLDHLVFNFGEDFDEHVVDPYVEAHATGITPNPCIECNRSIKFARLAERADVLGFDAVATGHHARIVERDGQLVLARGADIAKDQSYVVHMIEPDQLARTLFPVGDLDKSEVRRHAAALGLRTADKPDSQDVCFITSTGGRTSFLGDRIPFHRADVVDTDGNAVGAVESVELVTIGQRRGLGLPGGGPKRYVVDVDVDARRVVVGDDAALREPVVSVANVTWAGTAPVAPGGEFRALVQSSAHGATRSARIDVHGAAANGVPGATVVFDEAQRRIAPGQTVVFYDLDDEYVIGGGIAVSSTGASR